MNGNLLFSTDIMLAGKIVPNTEKAKTVFSFLYLLSQAEKKAKKNNIQRLIIYIKIKVNGICFDDLSEGERNSFSLNVSQKCSVMKITSPS